MLNRPSSNVRPGLGWARHGLWALALLAAAAVQAQTTYTRAQLQEIYQTHLTSEGYRPEITSAGNVRFKREGQNYLIYVDDRDPHFFRVYTGFVAEDQSAPTRLRRLEAANLANLETKVAKVFLDQDGHVNFSIEVMQETPGDANKSLNRLLLALDLAARKYSKKFRGED